MSRNPQPQHTRRRPHLAPVMDGGQALPLALIAMAAGFLMVTVFALALGVYVKISAASASDLLDYYAADAGIERAIAPLAADPAAYPAPATLTLDVNNRPVSISVAPLASQIIPAANDILTTTVTTYLVTSTAPPLTIKARAEARKTEGQPSGSVRITAWKVGQ